MGKIASKTGSLLYVGIDIAAYKADVYLRSEAEIKQRAFEIKQDETGFKYLLLQLKKAQPIPGSCRILLEATGNYWIDLATMLDEAGYLISVVNPRRAHNFMKTLPARGKSDRIDAKALSLMAEQQEFSIWQPPAEIYYEFRDYLTRRDDIVNRITALKNQRHAYKVRRHRSEAILSTIEEEIKALSLQRKKLKEELKELTKSDAGWQQTIELLETINGIGLITACWLTMVTNNFSSCENVEQLINYIGLAPLPYQSGKSIHQGSRLNKGSNGQMRKVLYMAARSAKKWNPVVKKYYDRLVNESHKPKKVALCAAMRKLIQIAWAVVHKKKAFYVPLELAS